MLVELCNVPDLTFSVRLSAMFYDSDLGQHLIKYLRITRENRVGKHGYVTPTAFNPGLVPCCIVSGTTECHDVHRAASGSRMIIVY